jgi:hypothetical protein
MFREFLVYFWASFKDFFNSLGFIGEFSESVNAFIDEVLALLKIRTP